MIYSKILLASSLPIKLLGIYICFNKGKFLSMGNRDSISSFVLLDIKTIIALALYANFNFVEKGHPPLSIIYIGEYSLRSSSLNLFYKSLQPL